MKNGSVTGSSASCSTHSFGFAERAEFLDSSLTRCEDFCNAPQSKAPLSRHLRRPGRCFALARIGGLRVLAPWIPGLGHHGESLHLPLWRGFPLPILVDHQADSDRPLQIISASIVNIRQKFSENLDLPRLPLYHRQA